MPNSAYTSPGCGDASDNAKRRSPQPPPASTASPDDGSPTQPSDPFRNLREEREKSRQSGFEYDPFSINKKLI